MTITKDITAAYDVTAEFNVLSGVFVNPRSEVTVVGYNSAKLWVFRSIWRFPLSALPSNATIQSVQLILGVQSGANVGFQIGRYNNNADTDPAGDSGITLFQRAACSSVNCVPSPIWTSGTLVQGTTNTITLGATPASQACVDLQSRLSAWAAGTATRDAFNVVMKGTNPETGNSFLQIVSSLAASGQRPVLRVTYTTPPSVPEISYPDFQRVVPVVGAGRPRPLFQFIYKHPDASPVSMDAFQLQVWNDGMSTAIFDSGTVLQSATNNTTVYYSYSFATSFSFSAGVWYRYRVRTRSVDGLWSDWTTLANTRYIGGLTPYTPTLSSPVSGQIIGGGSNPTLVWDYTHANGVSQVFSQIELAENVSGNPVSGYPKYTAGIFDNFDRANGALGSALTGQAWTANLGTIQVATNQAQATALDGTTGYAVATIDAGFSTAYLHALVSSTGTGNAGVVFLYSDTANFWRFEALSTGTWRIVKRVAGSESTVASGTSPYTDQNFHVRIRIPQTGTIICFVDGQKVTTITDSFNSTATRYGLFFTGANAQTTVDYFFVVRSDLVGNAVTQHQVSGSLTLDLAYKWRITNYDELGRQSSTSAYSTFTWATPPTVTLTAPTSGQVIGSPTPSIQWTYSLSGHPQSGYQVVVYGSDTKTVVYDSGFVSGSATAHTIPVGYLTNLGTYYVRVTAWDDRGLSGQSAVTQFSTSWTPPAAITGFSATADSTNAKVNLSWTASSLAPEDFAAYAIWRRRSTSDPYVLIAYITTQSTTTYSDYLCYLATSTQFASQNYKIAQVQNFGSELVYSGDTVSGQVLVTPTDNPVWICDAVSPATYFAVFKYRPERSITRKQELTDVQLWGRTAPVRHYGDADYSRGRLQFFVPATDTAQLTNLEKLIANKRTVCVRDARGRRFFANLDPYVIQDVQPTGFTISVEFTETSFEEVPQ
jgi:hypothetical protein